MNLEEIKKFLEENKDNAEVQAFLKGLKSVSMDDVKAFLEGNEEGKKFLQSEKDSYVTKAIETWKKNNLQKLVDEEVSKKFPTETPEQKAIKDLQEKLDAMEREKALESIRNKVILHANEKKLPLELVNMLVSDDEEATFASLAIVEKVFSSHVEQAVNERFKAGGRNDVGGGNPGTHTGPNPFAKDTLNLTEQGRLLRDNPELAKKLAAEAGIQL